MFTEQMAVKALGVGLVGAAAALKGVAVGGVLRGLFGVANVGHNL